MNKLQSKFGIADTEVISRENCHSGFLQLDRLQLRHKLFAGGWSKVMDRELLVKGQAVGVLLFDPSREEVVLVRQFRVGMIDEKHSPWLLELVAGMVEEKEDLLEVARREAEEESNCSPENLIEICSYYNSPGTSNEKLSLFCGQVDAGNAGGVFGLSEEHEDIQVVVLPVNALFAAVDSGLINNAMTIIASQWLQLHKEELVQRWN
jgi:ADP-ribose pyrophosphatase|tara:strand:+ start:30667 stop:31287 length:621 start_codon:yes stop_codon:yes gene_type:complete